MNIEFLKNIHAGADSSCFVSILRNWDDEMNPMERKYAYEIDIGMNDRFYTLDSFLQKANQLIKKEVEETYFSINAFWTKRKSTNDIRHLNAFVLDYDFYKISEYKNLSPEDMYREYIKETLPFQPTYVVDSGRGLYVLYLFHHTSYKMLKLYRAIYQSFLKSQEKFGMDAKAMNATQVIRVPGTYNVKADKVVTIIEHNATNYDLTDLATILKFTYDEVVSYKKNRSFKKEEKNILSFQKMRRKGEARKFLNDLEKLIVIRNRSGYFEGYREQLIYLAREKMEWAGFDIEESLKKANNLNQQFKFSLTENQVNNQCKPSKIFNQVTSIEKVIRKLGISLEEQAKLNYLQTRKYKDLRKKRLSNKHPLLNRTKKEIEQLERRTYVAKLKKEGRRNVEIANILEVNKSTITNDLKYIQNHKNEFRKILAETIEELIRVFSNEKLLRTIRYDIQKKLQEWLKISPMVLEEP